MLTCYGNEIRLPQNDLAYLAFRLAVQDTLSDLELQQDLDDDLDCPLGFLSEVPFLHQVPLPVQVDLLAETWHRHCQSELIEASLLDAAIVYAACRTAARVIDDMPKVMAAYLDHAPRRVNTRLIRRATYRLADLFDDFWDDYDFLLIDDLQDLPPNEANAIKELMNIPDEWVQPMFDALERWHVSPDVAEHLAGLLTEEEIAEVMPQLRRLGSAVS
jgi:hypothetical protein